MMLSFCSCGTALLKLPKGSTRERPRVSNLSSQGPKGSKGPRGDVKKSTDTKGTLPEGVERIFKKN